MSNAWNDCNAVGFQLFQYDEEVFNDQHDGKSQEMICNNRCCKGEVNNNKTYIP